MMELFTTKAELRAALAKDRQDDLSVGFVPTMGALHEGHLSLVSRAGAENDKVVVSIFVNPTQFNDPTDLERYPRTLEKDLSLLAPLHCDYLFAPTVSEVYPEPDTRKFNFGSLETVMEGKFRPGHFNGVAQVVSKLFDIVEPDRAYFGKKDFQQYSIILNMCKVMGYPIEIVPCDIVREADGLAMSSRNMLLSEEYRAEAPVIYRTLLEAQRDSEFFSPEEVRARVVQRITDNSLLKMEYFEIVDELTLQPLHSWEGSNKKVGCIAVFAGKVRLIDNIYFDK